MQDLVETAEPPASQLPNQGPTQGESVSAAAIAAIFERVLVVSPVDDDGDFFALGGDSITATALAIELEAEFGVKLPVSILFDAPTPAMLAGAVASLAARGQDPLVLLKPGSGAPPLFLAPGAGGWLTAVRPVAEQMDVPCPIYGFRVPGLDGMKPPLARVEQLAGHFLPAIRSVQPHGPYFLGGYSMGGLVAFELAQLLTAAGEEVALLALFDTYICPRRLAWASKLAVWRRRFAHHATNLRAAHWRTLPHFILARCRSLLGDLGIFPRPSPGMPSPDDTRVTPAMRRVVAAGLAASVAYRPRYYPGTITYFEARNSHLLPAYPDLTWRPLARRLAVHVVDGDHWQIVLGRSANTARQLSACVRRALAGHPNPETPDRGPGRTPLTCEGFQS